MLSWMSRSSTMLCKFAFRKEIVLSPAANAFVQVLLHWQSCSMKLLCSWKHVAIDIGQQMWISQLCQMSWMCLSSSLGIRGQTRKWQLKISLRVRYCMLMLEWRKRLVYGCAYITSTKCIFKCCCLKKTASVIATSHRMPCRRLFSKQWQHADKRDAAVSWQVAMSPREKVRQ